MADDPTKPATGEPDPKPDPKPADQLGDAGKKALEAERAARREAEKKAAELERRLGEIEDKDKSELQRAIDRATAAENRATEAERRALVLEVATAKGLTPAQAKRLAGTTKEELESDADELLETFKPAGDSNGTGEPGGGGAKPPAKPTENLKGGNDPTQDPPPDIRKIVDEIPRDI